MRTFKGYAVKRNYEDGDELWLSNYEASCASFTHKKQFRMMFTIRAQAHTIANDFSDCVVVRVYSK